MISCGREAYRGRSLPEEDRQLKKTQTIRAAAWRGCIALLIGSAAARAQPVFPLDWTYGDLARDAALVVGPDPLLEPNYSETSLAVGFMPDPFTTEVFAGGEIDAGTIPALAAAGCVGFISTAPDYQLYYTAGDAPVVIGITSDADTTLVINDPQGNWICADDTDGHDPAITFSPPLSGQYAIWVGTILEGDTPQAELRITGRVEP